MCKARVPGSPLEMYLHGGRETENTISLTGRHCSSKKIPPWFNIAAVSLQCECCLCDHQRSVSPQAAAQRGREMLLIKDENKLA